MLSQPFATLTPHRPQNTLPAVSVLEASCCIQYESNTCREATVLQRRYCLKLLTPPLRSFSRFKLLTTTAPRPRPFCRCVGRFGSFSGDWGRAYLSSAARAALWRFRVTFAGRGSNFLCFVTSKTSNSQYMIVIRAMFFMFFFYVFWVEGLGFTSWARPWHVHSTTEAVQAIHVFNDYALPWGQYVTSEGMQSFDFARLYTNIPIADMHTQLTELVDLIFEVQGARGGWLQVSKDPRYTPKWHDRHSNPLTALSTSFTVKETLLLLLSLMHREQQPLLESY